MSDFEITSLDVMQKACSPRFLQSEFQNSISFEIRSLYKTQGSGAGGNTGRPAAASDDSKALRIRAKEAAPAHDAAGNIPFRRSMERVDEQNLSAYSFGQAIPLFFKFRGMGYEGTYPVKFPENA